MRDVILATNSVDSFQEERAVTDLMNRFLFGFSGGNDVFGDRDQQSHARRKSGVRLRAERGVAGLAARH